MQWWIALVVPGHHVVHAQEADRTRIRAHLSVVETELRARALTGLTATQRRARQTHLDALRTYWQRGDFPRNVDFPDARQPYFIDDIGTACAVGHLMIESGAPHLARAIHDHENNARVFDIQTPGVSAWARRTGLTLEELARIQPSYCFCRPDDTVVCGVDGVTYGNACVATTCAGVEIDHEGPCAVETGSTWPDPQAATTTGMATGTSTGADQGASCTGTETTGHDMSTTGEFVGTTGVATGGTETGAPREPDESACTIGTDRLPRLSWCMLLLACTGRRRCTG